MHWTKRMIYAVFPCVLLFGCKVKHEETKQDTTHQLNANIKPGSGYVDTLIVSAASAIFYQPDSGQLKKIQTVTDKRVFEGSMHEFFYQQRNAHLFLKKYWPHLKIFDARNVRYILFADTSGHFEVIDLDKQGDAYGMFVFAPGKLPRNIDMSNVESQVPSYFQEH